MARDDKSRLARLRSSIIEIHASDPEFALKLASESLGITAIFSDLPVLADIRLAHGICCCSLGRYRDALGDLREAHDLFASWNRTVESASSAFHLGYAHDELGELRQALEWYMTALGYARRTGQPETDEGSPKGGGAWPLSLVDIEAKVVEALGDLYCGLGDFPSALDFHFRCLAIQRELNNADGIGIALSAIGRVHGLSGDLNAAFEYYTKSLEVFHATENRVQEVKALANLGGIYFSRGDLDRALEHYMVALTIYDMLDDRLNVVSTLVCIGNIYEKRGDLEAARAHYHQAWDSADEAVDAGLQGAILLNIGNLYRKVGDHVRGRLVLDQALGIAQSIDAPFLQYQIHEALALVYEQLEYPAQALEHYKRFAQIRHELAGEEKQKEIAKLQVQLDVATAERELKILQIEAERLDSEMKIKESKLMTATLHLAEKYELLDTLKEQVMELSQDRPGKQGEVVNDIVSLIEASRGTENDWDQFEEQMNVIYPDFVRTLADRYPALTPTELRVCSLLKLGRSTKEIAAIMYASVRTIEVHRYNIGKKVELDKKMRLAAFLAAV